MDKMSNSSKGLFKETPASDEPHIVNYLKYVGDCLRRYRVNLPAEKSSAKRFGHEVLHKYFGKPIARSRIERAESGNGSSQWEMIAAYFHEIGIFPDILEALERGHKPTLRYMLLVKKEREEALKLASEEAQAKLSNRAEKEKSKGTIHL
jgi:hypothetical protein